MERQLDSSQAKQSVLDSIISSGNSAWKLFESEAVDSTLLLLASFTASIVCRRARRAVVSNGAHNGARRARLALSRMARIVAHGTQQVFNEPLQKERQGSGDRASGPQAMAAVLRARAAVQGR